MAEPLLRRTFSRLRGRKGETKDRGSPPEPAVSWVPPSQPWGPFSFGGREQKPPQNSSDLGDPQNLFPQPFQSPRTPNSQGLELGEKKEKPQNSQELENPGKIPIYLQSLERSSRLWVLSCSGKGPPKMGGGPPKMGGVPPKMGGGPPEMGGGPPKVGAGAERGFGEGGDPGDIWYNPIPEDEDIQAWKRGDTHLGDCPPKVAEEETPSPPPPPHWGGTLGTTGGTGGDSQGEEAGGGRSQDEGRTPSPWDTSGTSPPPSSPPANPKKCRSGPKPKSPGPVRRLSMKMKKIPELRRKLSLRTPRTPTDPDGIPSGGEAPSSQSQKESGNVITRYHLDTSVATKPGLPSPKISSQNCSLNSSEFPIPSRSFLEAESGEKNLDLGIFQAYNSGETGGGRGEKIWGSLNVHLHGVGELKFPREVFCLLKVDGIQRARTALLPCSRNFLPLNHTFNLELEGARDLQILIFSWDPNSCRNRPCCHGNLFLPQLFRGGRAQQLAVKLQPRGVLYSKVTLGEVWDEPGERERREGGREGGRVFGVELGELVEREQTGSKVPLLVQKCLEEIEKRGLKVVGLYRLCGSAVLKRRLRGAFERDSGGVNLGEELYPDIHVITGILKDFLRELPSPLLPPPLLRTLLEASEPPPGQGPPRPPLQGLPQAQEATLRRLLDHLSLVATFQPFNLMSPQNLSLCFGPVLLPPPNPPNVPNVPNVPSPPPRHPGDFKSHIQGLNLLLQSWPAPPSPPSPLFPRGGPQLRSRGPESPPSHRLAGLWSLCHPPQGTTRDPGDNEGTEATPP